MKQRQLIRLVVHVVVTIATYKAVFVGLLLLAWVLTGDNPSEDSWGFRAVGKLDHWAWLIVGFFTVIANLATWALFRFFGQEQQPNQVLLRNAGIESTFPAASDSRRGRS